MGKSKKIDCEPPPEEVVICKKPEYDEDRINLAMFDPDSDDPLVSQRGKCLQNCAKVRRYFDVYKECDRRVMKKIQYTAETCAQEAVDLIMAVDHCVNGKAFSKLA